MDFPRTEGSAARQVSGAIAFHLLGQLMGEQLIRAVVAHFVGSDRVVVSQLLLFDIGLLRRLVECGQYTSEHAQRLLTERVTGPNTV